MNIFLPTVAVAFAAFCVWLTVRIVNRRERWAKWTAAILVGLPMLYVLGFGPACWLVDRGHLAADPAARAYKPVLIVLDLNDTSRPAQVLQWYVAFGSAYNPKLTMFRMAEAAGVKHYHSGRGFTPMRRDQPLRSIQ